MASSVASTLTPSALFSIIYIEKLILLLSSFSLSRRPYISQLCPQFISKLQLSSVAAQRRGVIYRSSPWGRSMIGAIGGKDGGLQVVEKRWG